MKEAIPSVGAREMATQTQWSRVGKFVADRLGLHFAPERSADLQRHLTDAATELGFDNVGSCIDWLLSSGLTRPQLEVLASHLTVGETYFFRDPRMFDVLRSVLLPRIIDTKQERGRRLRVWSAGCASGEEAYSLAILLRQVLPDVDSWPVTVLATDINAKLLRKASAAVYGDWSFRGGAPALKSGYFSRVSKREHVVRPEIQRMVTFEPLNLAEDVYPSLATNTNAMDLILCRNVLMYFTRAQARSVVRKLHDALIDGGYLIVSPTEMSQDLFKEFVTVTESGVCVYQKKRREPPPQQDAVRWIEPDASFASASDMLPVGPAAATATPEPSLSRSPAWLYEHGEYLEAIELLTQQAAHSGPGRFSLLVRSLANLGRLHEAREWCDRWIATHKLDAAAYYLRGVVLIECGVVGDARRSLQQAVYLDPEFALAHFALATLARRAGRTTDARRHFANARQILSRLQADDLLPESDGLTAGRLAETIAELADHG